MAFFHKKKKCFFFTSSFVIQLLLKAYIHIVLNDTDSTNRQYLNIKIVIINAFNDAIHFNMYYCLHSYFSNKIFHKRLYDLTLITHRN